MLTCYAIVGKTPGDNVSIENHNWDNLLSISLSAKDSLLTRLGQHSHYTRTFYTTSNNPPNMDLLSPISQLLAFINPSI